MRDLYTIPSYCTKIMILKICLKKTTVLTNTRHPHLYALPAALRKGEAHPAGPGVVQKW